jgi:hypothetical protein
MAERKKLFIAVPVHYGCDGRFVISLVNNIADLNSHGIEVGISIRTGESLVQRARNRIVDEFLKSDATHLLFIDADQSFSPDGARALLETGLDLVGAFVPKKGINWQRVRDLAIAGKSAEEIREHASDVVINIKRGDYSAVNGCLPVDCIGTGMMLVTRRVFETMIAEFGHEIAYSGKAEGEPEKITYAFFDAAIHTEDKRYLSEDYVFCIRAKSVGFQTYGHPGIKVIHWGTHGYEGDIESLITFKRKSDAAQEGDQQEDHQQEHRDGGESRKAGEAGRGNRLLEGGQGA